MRTLTFAGATALALAAIPAMLAAQDAPQPAPATPTEATEPAPSTTSEANAEAHPLPTTVETIPGATPSEPDTVVTTHHGNLTPPPATAMNKTYPLCTRTLQDSCRNPGEGDGRAQARTGDTADNDNDLGG